MFTTARLRRSAAGLWHTVCVACSVCTAAPTRRPNARLEDYSRELLPNFCGFYRCDRGSGLVRIGLADDPDMLDPTMARTFTGRIVFAALCDKLVDIDPELSLVPQLATEWYWTDGNKGLVFKLRPGVKFQDGEPLDAAAVKFSIERHLTLPGSTRKAEINAVKRVEIIDDHTVKLVLSAPSAVLLSQLADRAGMIVAPK